jgi:hypothetical protein
MKMVRWAIGAITIGIVLAIADVKADPEACRDALDQFKSARSDVSDSLRSYASCVSSSDGHDDCSREFSQVHSAQDDFESAVSSYEGDCS